MVKSAAFTIVALALLAFSVWSQDKTKPKQDQPSTPRGEELVANNVRDERLMHPNFVSLELVPMPRDGKLPETPFRVGDRIMFSLVVTQNLSEPWDISATDVYDQDRPELRRDGDPIPYKKNIAALVKTKDQTVEVFSVKQMTIEPGKPSAIATINLEQWFGRLAVGHYQLSVRHGFTWGGDWVESNAVTFEIEQQ